MKQKLLNSIKLRTMMLVALMCTAFAGQAWATDVTYTFTAKEWTSDSGNWSGDAGSALNAKGVQCLKDVTYTVTSPSSISNISSIVVTYGTAKNTTTSSKISIKVGSNSAVEKAVAGKSLTDATLTWSYSPTQSGSIEMKVTAAGASVYVKSVKVTYADGFVVTYNANGATSGSVPTDATSYSSGATVTVKGNTGSLAKVANAFGGWNTQADGLGTNYTAGTGTFSITANTTLYAKWNAKTISTLTYSGTLTKSTYYAGQSFDPEGLTVTATYSDASEEDVTSSVTWTPDPLTKGTTAVTGAFMGKEIEVMGLTVTAVPGTEENPYTVAQALAYIAGGGSTSDIKYVSGIISQIESDAVADSKYLTYSISADGTKTNELYVYKGKNLGNTAFTAVGNIAVGDKVTICGKLKEYSSTKEFAQDNYLVSQVRDFTLTLDDMSNGSAAVQVNGVAQVPNGDGEVTVASGATVTLTATPDDGYAFAKWSSTNDSENNSTENPLEFTMPFDDVMVGATFADASIKYDIVVDDDVVGGSIEADVAEAKAGATVTLTATPDDGYVFDSWDVQDGSSNTVTVTSNQFTMPASEVTVTATFLPVYTVNYYIGGVKNSTTRVSGEELNLDAPSTGFAGWSTANSAASPVFMANDAAVTSDLDVYAIFITSYSADYRLVEANQADWRGDYLIAYDDDTFADGRKGGTDSGCIGASGVSVDPDSNLSGKVVDLAWGDTYKVTLEAIDNSDLSDGYVLKTQDGKYNYYTSNNNGLSSTATKETAANYPITVTFTSSSDVKLALGGSAAGAVFRYNTNGYFRYYKNGGQSAVHLYKRTLTATYSLDAHEAVTVGSAGYTTYVTPSKVSFPSGVTGYIATATHASSVTLTEVTTVPADEPIVVKAEAGTYYLPVVTTAPDDVTSNLLKASDGSVKGNGSNIFALGVGKVAPYEGVVGFYLVNNGQTVPAGKAYLEVTAPGVKGFTFDFDGVATGVNAIAKGQEATANGQIFNLAGQRVNKAQKGLYIMNGKKVLVK